MQVRNSPFPNTSTLLAGELKCNGITDEEDNSIRVIQGLYWLYRSYVGLH